MQACFPLHFLVYFLQKKNKTKHNDKKVNCVNVHITKEKILYKSKTDQIWNYIITSGEKSNENDLT